MLVEAFLENQFRLLKCWGFRQLPEKVDIIKVLVFLLVNHEYTTDSKKNLFADSCC